MTTEFSMPYLWNGGIEVSVYLNSLDDGTWYWTLPYRLFTFENEEDAIMFRLKFGL